jgi:hypothetical protein
MRGQSMLGRAASAVAAILLVSSAASAVAAEPIGQWKLEPSDVRCVAVRQYRTADKPVTLALKVPAEGNAVQLAILRTGFRTAYLQTVSSIEIDGRKFPTSALSYPTGGDNRRVTHLIDLDTEPAAALRGAKTLKVDVYKGVKESFQLEPSIAVWRDLQDCVARLRDTWNVGEERESRFATNSKGDLQSLFSPEDYPLAASKELQQGTTGFLILIDEHGVPKDCTVIVSSGAAILDSRSCGVILARAKFSPAIGHDGVPMKSAFTKRVTWRFQ